MQYVNMVFLSRKKYDVILMAAILSACIGCGSKTLEVKGDVTYDGQPVDSGSIVFLPADGSGPSVGGTITAGRYQVVGEPTALLGKKAVQITVIMKTGRQVPAGPPTPPGSMVEEVNRIAIAPLEVEVVSGKTDEIPFILTSTMAASGR